MKKLIERWDLIKTLLIIAIIIMLFITPIIIFCWLYIHEKQTTIVAIEYSCKVAMCTWGLLGCLGTVVTIVIKAALSNLEELRKTDEYLAGHVNNEDKLVNNGRITVFKLLNRVSTFSDLCTSVLSHIILVFGNKTTRALTKYYNKHIEFMTTQYDEK